MADRTVKGTLEWDVSDLIAGTKQGVKALRDTADEADRTEKALAEGFDEGVKASGRMQDSIRQTESKLSDLGALAGAGALGAVTVELDSQSGAAGRLQAQLGLTAEETERVGDVARDVFTNNFGESLSDAGDTVALVRGSLRDLSDDDLRAVSEGVLATQDAFGNLGADVPILVEDIRAMTENFPGISEADALDLIVDGFQRGTGNAGDLQDTLQEYPGDFARIGLDAEDMFGILNAGMEAGVRNTDIVADAIREMSIRITEEGGKAEEALASMFGPEEADRLQRAFAEGGEAGRDAFFTVAEGLAAVEDPLERNSHGIEIMGTRWEDAANQMPAFLGSLGDVEDGAADAAGATESLNAQYENGASTLETWKRRLSVGAVGALGDFAGGAAEAGTSLGTLLLGVQGLGVDLPGLGRRVKGFDWQNLKPSRTQAVAAGVAAIAVAADAVFTAMAADYDTTGFAEGMEKWLETGESAQFDAATGGVDGLAESLNRLFSPDLVNRMGRGGLQHIPLLGGSVKQELAESRESIEAVGDAVADMLDQGRTGDASRLFNTLTTAAKDAGVPIEDVVDLMPNLADKMDEAGLSAEDLQFAWAETNDTARDSAGATEAAAVNLDKYLRNAIGAARESRDLGGAIDDTELEFQDLTDAAATVDEAVGDLIDRFRDMTGGQRDVREANAAHEAALDDLTASYKENGSDLRAHTESGRENMEMLHGVQRAAEDHALAVLKETGSIDKANATLDTHRDNLYDTMLQLGYTEEEAKTYTEEIKRIPDDAATRAEFEAAKAREDLQGWNEKIDSIPGQRETFARLVGDEASVDNWLAKLQTIQDAVVSRGEFKSVGGPSALHEGTDYWGDGPVFINDNPNAGIVGELVHLPIGASVTPSEASVDMIAEGMRRSGIGGGRSATYNIYGDPTPKTVARFKARELVR